jgi:hypothetical protein
MPIVQFCWRCGRDVAMLDSNEWQEIEPLLQQYVKDVKDFRGTVSDNQSLERALRQGFDRPALERFYKMTGQREHNIMSIWHHRASLYGPPCEDCGKPLRTPIAKVCAGCGRFRELP